MGITVTADEADRKIQGMRETRKEIARKGGAAAVQELSERVLELDRTAIHNPNPRYAYRLANRDHKGRVGVLKGLGYEIVPPSSEEQLVTGIEQDGGQTHGDLVLMRTKVENYERRRADKRARLEMTTGAFIQQAKENMEKAGRDSGAKVTVIDESGDK